MPSYVDMVDAKVKKVIDASRERDEKMRRMHLILSNRAREVFASQLPDDYPDPIIENTIRSAAEDLSMMVGVLPSLSAAGSSALDESRRSRADKLSRIIGAHTYASGVGSRMPFAALQQIAYGFSVFRVEPLFDERRPHVHVESSIGSYYSVDRFRRPVFYFRAFQLRARELAWLYPEHAERLMRRGMFGDDGGNEMLDVVRFYDAEVEILFVPRRDRLVLEAVENRLGKVMVTIAEGEPTAGDPAPSMNDSVAVMGAKAELALLNLEAASKAVQAPIAVPDDVDEFVLGPDAILRTNSPRDVVRVGLDVPNGSIFEVRNLDDELKRSTHYPDVRAGQTDASVVTGRGVQALMGGFDQRVKTYQSNLGDALAGALSLSLEMDKVYFGGQSKKVYAAVNGTSYEVTYTPDKDIYSTDVQAEYGVMAGLDPNRALVWSLQAMGAGLVSKQFVMTNLPVNLDVGEELKLLDVEALRTASMAAMQGYAASIPQMAAAGQDPVEAINRITAVIEDRKRGVAVEEAMTKAFTPPEPSPEELAAQEAAMTQADSMAAAPGGGPMPGMPGMQAPAPPQAPPSMSQLLTQLNGDGTPRTSVRQVRQALI